MLEQELRRVLPDDALVVCVGDSSHGDDGAGPLIARLLADAGFERVVDSGASPECDTWRYREMAPDSVLFVDAVDFGGSPGDAALLGTGALRRKGFDTHRAPLKLTMEYLESSLGCVCFLLAVQPKHVGLGAPMSGEVRSSAEHLAEIILHARSDGGTLS